MNQTVILVNALIEQFSWTIWAALDGAFEVVHPVNSLGRLGHLLAALERTAGVSTMTCRIANRASSGMDNAGIHDPLFMQQLLSLFVGQRGLGIHVMENRVEDLLQR